MTTKIILAFALATCSLVGAQDVPCPAPTPDPIYLEPGNVNITVLEAPGKIIVEIVEGSVHGGSTAEGHTKIEAEIGYNAITQVVTYAVNINSISIEGIGLDASGQINSAPFRPTTIPNGPFTANGAFAASANGFHAAGRVGILVNLITNRVNLRFIEVNELDFDSVSVDLGTFISSGQQVDWPAWNANFKTAFFADWAAGKQEILDRVKVPVNEELKKYTLADFLAILFPPAPEPCYTTLAPLIRAFLG